MLTSYGRSRARLAAVLLEAGVGAGRWTVAQRALGVIGRVLNNVALLNSFPDASRTPADVHRNWLNSACLYASASWQSDAATSPEKAVWRRSDRPVRLQIERPTLGCDQPALGEIISWQRRVNKNVQPRRFFVFKLRSCVSPRFTGPN
ncbi:hypothetical protein L1887_56441 [Cichorium endivia]|nr:hypothetical protein L1887_56441 [Cichorium endivia]